MSALVPLPADTLSMQDVRTPTSTTRVSRSIAPWAAGLLLAFALDLVPGAQAKPVTVADLLADSPSGDWRAPDADNTLYLELPGGRVIIELAPQVAPRHVADVRVLARAHYFDGLSIVRVQDDYVVQWNDPGKHHPVPDGVQSAVEFTAPAGADARFERLPIRDVYAPEVGFLDGFPAARDPRSHTAWLAHCYGMVGIGRDDPPESNATEMYAVIGHAPRQLDRNVSLVGRVLRGMELLASLPRGDGELGFYLASQPLVPIRSLRVAADLPQEQRTPIEVLRTNSATFRSLLEQRRNRREPWFQFNPAAIDLCNVPLPVRLSAPARR